MISKVSSLIGLLQTQMSLFILIFKILSDMRTYLIQNYWIFHLFNKVPTVELCLSSFHTICIWLMQHLEKILRADLLQFIAILCSCSTQHVLEVNYFSKGVLFARWIPEQNVSCKGGIFQLYTATSPTSICNVWATWFISNQSLSKNK